MSDLTGAQLGHYRILELIGRGGMATVYKAYQPGTERLVAVKVMHTHLVQDPLIVERFRQEARVIAHLEHRNIVPVYEFGQQDGVLYLAMRYLRAGTAQDVMAHGPLSLKDASSLLDDIAAGLDHAHAQHIIHRDIKPHNILVDGDGHAYLTDFGLAKVLGTGRDLTQTSMTMGTPAYIAPEQALGLPVTAQTDIYALGVMLYEMLTGEPPYNSDSPMAMALMHVQGQFRPPRQVNPALSETAELVILRAMAKEPADRYRSAGEMARALAEAVTIEQPAHLAAVAGEIAQAKSPELVTPDDRRELREQDRRAQRRRLLALAPWGAAGCLVIALLAALWFTANANAGSRLSDGQTATAVAGLLDQLHSAQTASAAGGAGAEATLQALQTQLAGASTGTATPQAAGSPSATPPAASSATSTTAHNNPPPQASNTPAPTQRPTLLPKPTLPRIIPTLPIKLP